MEHTQEQLAHALQTLGFQRIAYPSEKYQVFENGKLRYLVGRDGALRRGASVNSSVALGSEEITRLLTEANEAMGNEQGGHEENSGTQHQAEPEQQETDNHQEAASPPKPSRGSSKQQVLVDLLTRAQRAPPALRANKNICVQRTQGHQRGTQEKAGAAYCLGEGKRWGTHLPGGSGKNLSPLPRGRRLKKTIAANLQHAVPHLVPSLDHSTTDPKRHPQFQLS